MSKPGLCECGCGAQTPIARTTRTALGHVRGGEHVRFVNGHQRRGARKERIWHTTDCGYTTDCWVWGHALRPDGYGQDYYQGRNAVAHRVIYELRHGPVPEGLELDHLCRNRACVNPDHLEPVTSAENTRRGAWAKLSMKAAVEIRGSDLSNLALAKQYRVHPSTISRVRTGQRWVA